MSETLLMLFVTGALSETQKSFLQMPEESVIEPSKAIWIFAVSLLMCFLCCGILQAAIISSKKMNIEYIQLRKNYKQYKGFLKFKELKNSLSTIE